MQTTNSPSADVLKALESVPVNICILATDFTILAASDAYLQVSGTVYEQLIGKNILEIFPDSAENYGSRGAGILKRSLQEALTTKKPSHIGPIRYDIQDPINPAKFRQRYWNTSNTPVLDESGQVSYIIHLPVEITESVLSEQRLEAKQNEVEQAYQNLMAANEELQASNEELVKTQDQLQQINTDLEQRVTMRTHELSEAKALSENQRLRLSTIINTLPAGVAILSGRDMILEFVNEGMLNLWDRKPSILNTALLDFMPELREQVFPQILDDVYTTGIAHFNEGAKVQLMINGKLESVYMDYSYTPLRNSRGEVDSILVLAVNVTERMLSQQREQELNEELTATNEELSSSNEELITTNEELIETQHNLKKTLVQLAESESRFRSMVKQAPVAIGVLAGRELKIELANDMILRLWGKGEEVIGMNLAAALPELEGQPFLGILDNVFTTGQPFYGNEAKVQLEHSGQLQEYYVNFIYHPLKDENGSTTAIIAVAVDVNEQVNARMALQRVEEMHRFSIEAANAGTWYMALQNKQLIASARMKELFGYYAHEEMPFEAALKQIPDEYRPAVVDSIEKAVANGESYSIEHPVIGFHDQKRRWVKGSGKVYLNEDMDLAHFSGIMLDITEQKQDEQRKNDFIGMVSHELKTPLTSMRGYLQMLQLKAKRAEDAFTASALEKSIKQVSKMTSLINGFLNVSRLEAGKIVIDKKPFNLTDLLTEMIDEATSIQSTHSISLQPCPQVKVNADQDKIGSVVSNLLSNAVKYSPQGRLIEVKCEVKGDFVQVSVKDDGMGIRPQDVDKLFERFYRVDNKHTQTISGFGIGLYLCAEIIQRHEGKIWVESELGKGSTFYFSLPLEA